MRTITWEDPRGAAEAGRSMSGLEYLQKIVAGELPRPPIGVLMDFDITELSEGRAVFVVEPAEYHYNPIGVVHGGLAATLLDSAMGAAVITTLDEATGCSTATMTVHYTRPINARTVKVLAEGWVVHRGSRLVTTEGRLSDEQGRLLAHGSATLALSERAAPSERSSPG